MDKGEDSKEVAKLIERVREAIGFYQVSRRLIVTPSGVDAGEQVSQQQAIYDQITDIAVSIL